MPRARRPFLPLYAACVLALSACTRSNEPALFPLEPGWSWHYRIAITEKGGTTLYKYVVENRSSQCPDGSPCVARESLDGSRSWYAVSSDGISRVASAAPGGEPLAEEAPRPLLKFPIAPGTRWTVMLKPVLLERTIARINAGQQSLDSGTFMRPLRISYAIEATDDSVEVPAGRFHNCTRVRGTGSGRMREGTTLGPVDVELEYVEWYCPQVGLARSQRTERTNVAWAAEQRYEQVLESYRGG